MVESSSGRIQGVTVGMPGISLGARTSTMVSAATGVMKSDRDRADARKRPRSSENDPATALAARFRGVVPQQNGNWGAQIYANHQRIWLGTFRAVKEAAMAYDSASIKLRRGIDSQRNFPWTNEDSAHEHEFQDNFTTEQVLDMIRDGTYQAKFEEFLRNRSETDQTGTTRVDTTMKLRLVHAGGQYICRQLFQKELTPSDVGKLNRLVIPKKNAVRHFPYIRENARQSALLHGEIDDDVQLVFYDRLMKSWKFRYCYWKSSQSFVFTRGWNRFVKENKLSAKDVIVFYSCSRVEGITGEGDTFCLIDVQYNDDCPGDDKAGGCDEESREVELQLSLGNSRSKCRKCENGKECEEEEEGLGDLGTAMKLKDRGFRLFGVKINRN